MRHYIALVRKDDASAYGVEFPDVPGCYSAADDMDSIVPNSVEALGLYAEDRDLPSPRSIETLRNDPAFAGEIAAGAFLVAVPLPAKAETRGKR